MAAPTTLAPMPSQARRETRSRVSHGVISATHTGVVLTSTTLFATEVKLSEEIHVAKCSARNNPASAPMPSSRRDNRPSSTRLFHSAKGSSTSVANVSRHAAVTSGGDSASRTKIAPLDTASTPTIRMIAGSKRGRPADDGMSVKFCGMPRAASRVDFSPHLERSGRPFCLALVRKIIVDQVVN